MVGLFLSLDFSFLYSSEEFFADTGIESFLEPMGSLSISATYSASLSTNLFPLSTEITAAAMERMNMKMKNPMTRTDQPLIMTLQEV